MQYFWCRSLQWLFVRCSLFLSRFLLMLIIIMTMLIFNMMMNHWAPFVKHIRTLLDATAIACNVNRDSKWDLSAFSGLRLPESSVADQSLVDPRFVWLRFCVVRSLVFDLIAFIVLLVVAITLFRRFYLLSGSFVCFFRLFCYPLSGSKIHAYEYVCVCMWMCVSA